MKIQAVPDRHDPAEQTGRNWFVHRPQVARDHGDLVRGAMKAEAAVSESWLLSAEEVADMIGMTADYVYELSRRGAIPTITFGRTRRYRREAVEEWLSHLEAWQRPVNGARPAP